jgi:hypothetical protein
MSTKSSLPDIWHPVCQLYWHPERSHPAETAWRLKWGDGRIGHIGIRSANPLTLEDFYWLLF